LRHLYDPLQGEANWKNLGIDEAGTGEILAVLAHKNRILSVPTPSWTSKFETIAPAQDSDGKAVQ